MLRSHLGVQVEPIALEAEQCLVLVRVTKPVGLLSRHRSGGKKKLQVTFQRRIVGNSQPSARSISLATTAHAEATDRGGA